MGGLRDQCISLFLNFIVSRRTVFSIVGKSIYAATMSPVAGKKEIKQVQLTPSSTCKNLTIATEHQNPRRKTYSYSLHLFSKLK